ncbi:CDP-alcohol phosphatidyltransferase-domain-containing protein [Phycomyces nitens]|nr:CDP-alcohol phosphatidyltransferase-domain-containing protein [Phycomyces nitens]
MSTISMQSLKTTKNVFLFIPNLIGYTRIILASLSLYFMPWHPKVCVILYCISCLLDAVDGVAARHFGQCSKFGAVLDMVTDRSTTTCLLCYLSLMYQPWAILFQFLIALDFSSHYMHMYSSMTVGLSSHKKLSESDSWFLRLYYNNNIVLFMMCAGNELFYVTLYILNFFGPMNGYWMVLLVLTGAICLAKNFINVIQIVNASRVLVSIDEEEREKALSAKEL